mmetsp:Transcript_51212/g.94556  ORF Transcript_51212/g.94556 Transcript_51212/m.94556 type:complete len:172 (-) Transcript_51212:65-580(-)
MNWFQAHLDRKANYDASHEEKTIEAAKSNQAIMEENKKMKDELLAIVLDNRRRLDRVTSETRALAKSPDFKPRVLPWQAQMEDTRRCVGDACKLLGKIRRDLERQARRVEDISLAVPEDMKRRKPPAEKEAAKPARNSASSAPIAASPLDKARQEKKEKKEKKKLRKQATG